MSQKREQLIIRGADAVEHGLEIAGVGSRGYAFAMDWHIRLILTVAWLGLGWLFVEGIGMEHIPTWGWYGYLLPAAMIYFFYHPVLEIAMRGRTPGKRMAGVRIVDIHGHTPGPGPLLIRNIFRLVDSLPAFYGLGLTVAMFTARQVRLGDLAAGTLLVHEENISAGSLERATHLLMNKQMTPGQQELLQDLLERWHGLDRATRITLAEKLLEKLGETRPRADSSRARDKLLHQALRRLADDSA